MKAVSTKIKQINHLGGIKKLDLLRINTFSEMSMSVLIETFSGRYTGQRPYKLHAPDDSRIAKATVPFSWSLAQLVTTAAVHVRNGQGGETGSVKRVRGSARFWTWNHRAWLVLGSGR